MEKYKVNVDGKTYLVEIELVDAFESVKKEAPSSTGDSNYSFESPLQGTVLSLDVKVGQQVKAGDLLCVIEAMKLQNEIVSPIQGTLISIETRVHEIVDAGQVLMLIKETS